MTDTAIHFNPTIHFKEITDEERLLVLHDRKLFKEYLKFPKYHILVKDSGKLAMCGRTRQDKDILLSGPAALWSLCPKCRDIFFKVYPLSEILSL